MKQKSEFMNPLFDLEHPFVHNEAVLNTTTPDKHSAMEFALHWLSAEQIMQQMWNNDGHQDYILLKQLFYDLCATTHIPYCNAVGFWHELAKSSKGDSGLDNITVNRLLMCALGSYGDIFDYATVRLLPRDFVFPSETDVTSYSENQRLIIERTNQISDDYNLSVSNFSDFRKIWDNHCLKKQKYTDWASKLDSVSYCDTTSDASIDAITPLANVFHQYICLLNEYSNSTHKDFMRMWKSWLKDKDSLSMSGVLQCICDNIEKEPKLARIAPVYVTMVFQKNTKNIYSSSSDRKREASYARFKPIDLSKALFEESESSNKKAPRNAIAITYFILREYYKHELAGKVDLELSDYIFETSCSMIGQKKYLTEDIYQKVINNEKTFTSEQFKKSDEWVHPLLQQCAVRLKTALKLYSSSAPEIVEGCEPSAQTKDQVDNLFPTKKGNPFTDEIIEEYQDILLNRQSALDGRDVTPERRWHLAELFDKILIRIPKLYELTQIPHNPDNIEILTAVSQAIHLQCMKRVSQRVYLQILSFLYQWFYSDKFQYNDTFCEVLEGELKRLNYDDSNQ